MQYKNIEQNLIYKILKNKEIPQKNREENETDKNFRKNPFAQYGMYSAFIFQMLATMGISFWGGNKLTEYFEIKNNLLTVGVGFLGMGLAFYNILNQLKNLEKKEKSGEL
jgi:hypothetical protein